MIRSSPSDADSSGTLGVSLVEVLLTLGVACLAVSLAMPMTAAARDEGRIRQAAAFAAARLREAQQQAVTRGTSAGLVFDRIEGRWWFRFCVDGNANGLRRSDLSGGVDRCLENGQDVAALFPGVNVDVDGAIPGPDGDPPSADPVRFGASDIASFSASGGCTPGSLFLRSASGAQYAIRIAGVTGRLRLLRYDPAARRWWTL